jgi:2'-5' RNA ligase
MKHIKSFNLLENKTEESLKGCLMLYYDIKPKSWIREIQNVIKNKDLHVQGIENEPHCTILYGFISDKTEPQKIEKLCGKYDLSELKKNIVIEDISLFENEKFDVLKLNIKSDLLTEMNKKCCDGFEYETNFPDYNAHITICYLQPGKGKKYLNEDLKNSLIKLIKSADCFFVYSDGNKNKNYYL